MSRGWSVRELVEQCAAVGFKVTSSVIENIEGQKRPSQEGRRRREVTADEVVALAYVLNVSPLSLLTPRNDLDRCRITSTVTLEAGDLGRWIAGQVPKVLGAPPFDRDGEPYDWRRELPGWRLAKLMDEQRARDAELRPYFDAVTASDAADEDGAGGGNDGKSEDQADQGR